MNWKILCLATSAMAILTVSAASADETTIIEQHHVVPGAPATTDVRTTSVVHHSRTYLRRVRHVTHRRTTVHQPLVAQRTDTAVVHDRTVTARSAGGAAADTAAATVDRKTVIHRNDVGDVTRHTRVQRQDADGTQTTIEHRSTTTPDDQADH